MSGDASRAFLRRLEPATAEALISLARTRRCPPKHVLFFEGDEAHDVMVVLHGQVKVAVCSPDGREVVLDVLGEGEILGELSAVAGGPRSATATTLTGSDVASVPLVRFNEFLYAHHDASRELLHALVARLREASRRQLEFGTLDALGRLCRRLVAMMDRYSQDAAEPVTISAPLSQQEIAGWSGLSREAVVKALHALRSLGWVETHSKTITVLDPAAVRARASLEPGAD